MNEPAVCNNQERNVLIKAEQKDTPLLSMIVATDDTYSTVSRTVSFLSRQTVLEQIELIVSCSSIAELNPVLSELEKFASYQIVECSNPTNSGQLVATAIKAARAPAFMYCEEHGFPPPGTAEVVIRELVVNKRQALGFGMEPSNPGLVAWSHIYGQFGIAVAPVSKGLVQSFGGHHAAYRTELLLSYSDDLSEIMANEAVLHEHLRNLGAEMYMTSEVILPHAQISNFFIHVYHEYLAQRVFASARARILNWSLARRLVYVFGSPLIPFLRTGRAVHHIHRTGRSRKLLPQILPVMFVAHVAGAIGEALGYMFGAGEKINYARMEIELDRYAFVNAADRDRAKQKKYLAKD